MDAERTSGEPMGFEAVDTAMHRLKHECELVKKRAGKRWQLVCGKLFDKVKALDSAMQVQRARIVELEEIVSVDDDFISQIKERTNQRKKVVDELPSSTLEAWKRHVEGAWDKVLQDRVEEESYDPMEDYGVEDDYKHELTGSFGEICRIFHTTMKVFVSRMTTWEDFCAELDKEGSETTEEHRWSQPLHRRLEEVLRVHDFSREDWNRSLPRGDGGIRLNCPKVPNEIIPDGEPENLTEEQIDLETRMKSYIYRVLQ